MKIKGYQDSSIKIEREGGGVKAGCITIENRSRLEHVSYWSCGQAFFTIAQLRRIAAECNKLADRLEKI